MMAAALAEESRCHRRWYCKEGANGRVAYAKPWESSREISLLFLAECMTRTSSVTSTDAPYGRPCAI